MHIRKSDVLSDIERNIIRRGQQTFASKREIKPAKINGFYYFTAQEGWGKQGYPFTTFYADFLYYLPPQYRGLEGIQQLCQHYYLQNGRITAEKAAQRTCIFLSSKEKGP